MDEDGLLIVWVVEVAAGRIGSLQLSISENGTGNGQPTGILSGIAWSTANTVTTTDLTTAHVVRFRGVLYDITRIDVFEGYKQDLTLYCSRRARQN